MTQLFIKFLVGALGLDKKRIKAQVYCYDDIYSVNSIHAYWEQGLGLSQSQFSRPVVNPYPQASARPSQKKRLGKLPYGTCHLRINDARLIHHIYGALEVYGNVFYRPQLGLMAHED